MDLKAFSAMYFCLLSLVQSLPIRPLAGTNVSEIWFKRFEVVYGRYLSVHERKKKEQKKNFEKYLQSSDSRVQRR